MIASTRLPVLLGAAALLVFAIALASGPVPLPPPAVAAGLFGGGERDAVLIVREVRLPRALLSLLLGAVLAAAGLLLQTLADNRLAAPSVLGIHNGANLGSILALVLAPGLGDLAYTAAALGGAMATTLCVAAIGAAGAGRTDRVRWVLGGVLLDHLAASLAVAILFAYGMQNALFGWTIGRLLHVDWQQVLVLGVGAGLAVAVAPSLAQRLDPLQLGETVARSLGADVVRLRLATLLTVVLLAGTATAVAGPVAYVGLVVPNVLTRTRVPSPRARLCCCALGGAVLTGTADLLARASSGQQTVPLGVWTMLLGACTFLALALRRPPRGSA
jgi:iron complex transport system permease protein